MSVQVSIDDLPAKIAEVGWAYVLTVRDDLRPHLVAVSPRWSEGSLVMSAGRGTAANAAARPTITLCYPPQEAGGMSLIVDGTATAGTDDVVTFVPTSAVLHRPAPD